MLVSNNISSYLNRIEKIWHVPTPRLLNTLFFNFRMCDWQEAIKMPIFIYGKTQITRTSGKVGFETSITPGMIKWGYDWGYRSVGKTRIRIEGNIVFRGKARILQSSDIAVFNEAKLIIGDNNLICENVLIYCLKRIELGDNVQITFQTSIMDSDFHYIVDKKTRSITPKSKKVIVGNNVWIGNRATIKKGTIIPDYTIVAASYSLLTKDYSAIPPFSILGGIPARLLKSGVVRTWKNEHQRIKQLDTWFTENPSEEYFVIPESEEIESYYK